MSPDPTLEAQAAPVAKPPSAAGGLVRAAAIISFGNVLSRVLGLVLETIIPDLFGATGLVSVFRVAETLVQNLYDFLVGGMVSAALVPVLSEHVERREELWQLVSIVLSTFAVLLALVVIALELLAEPLIAILGPGYDPALQATAVQMIRVVLPALFFLGIAGILTGVLYSLKQFTYPAFTNAAYNVGIILVALLLTPRFHIFSLVVGILVGTASQVLLQLPGLRGARLHLSFDWRHPVLRQIVKLYLPVVGGYAVSLVGVAIDRNLASRTGDNSLAWMQQATTLREFPLGLAATAIALAILPTLSRAVSGIEFRATLALGLKLVLLLILPATVGLYLLARPIVALLFEHGAFTPEDTLRTAQALQFYVLGLPFAAIDQPLVFAFYARKNTLTPNLVALIGVAIYIAVAFVLIQPLGYLGLVLANSAQLTGHALVMLYLTKTRLGGIGGEGIGATVLKIAALVLLMGAVVMLVSAFSPEGSGLGAEFMRVLLPTASALVVYVAGLKLLRVREADELWGIVGRKIRGR
jgi:putative peptidoglycan lipid II flippase